ncbi:hypothetical protein A1OO_22485 [Enterovibrio norvegicus FF-33]|uniref:Uncharacterized protein n=1 Tax=Enterovibrio norvegicus FF-454 TaxID=1185651 RepID=A0A1E5C4R4_9GAMM|nr:hypothetical protein [Enterovibrio norvegicus]OEE60514.1 hypothetical protein A1OK_11220 [Enterovibrio norvegicus FF-454]OEE70990.1 hypothetical protein A1OO_22485 [Enterovibrio norvegicus FF-33]OEE84631.1 hypothetical protein A1OQ_18630 [Enterovibrio norvegicus FF-162]
MMKAVKTVSSLFVLALLALSQPASANDFPTLERVKFVQECMALKGGPSYVNMYGCSCVIDKISEQLAFDDYVHADAFLRLRNMRGERGGYFRSSKDSRTARGELLAIREEADQQCFSAQQITRIQQ